MPSIGGTQSVGLHWLRRVRTAAIAAEAGAIAVASTLAGAELPIVPMALIVAAQALSNALSYVRVPFGTTALTLGLLLLDSAALTGLLALSGGASNPASALYFVQVALAAMLLPRVLPWLVSITSCAGYGLLFLVPDPASAMDHHHGHHAGFEAHLYGMFVAFAITTVVITMFVSRLSEALRKRSEELELAQERAHRMQRVAALTTLAAGAAHELGSPLATIAVIARELERSSEAESSTAARVIREEVERCKEILASMSAQAGALTGESPERITVRELFAEIEASWVRDNPLKLEIAPGDQALRVPRRAMVRMLDTLLCNAADASAKQDPIVIRFAEGSLFVEDRGSGMEPAVLERATEPFFTTKEPGRGMGLGLYLVSAAAEAMGATLRLESEPRRGTRVGIAFPPEALEEAPT